MKSQGRGDQRKHFWEEFLNLVQKISFGPPLRFFLTQVKISFGPPLWGYLLNFLKNRGGGYKFTLVPPLRFFPKNFFQGRATPYLQPPWWTMLIIISVLYVSKLCSIWSVSNWDIKAIILISLYFISYELRLFNILMTNQISIICWPFEILYLSRSKELSLNQIFLSYSC